MPATQSASTSFGRRVSRSCWYATLPQRIRRPTSAAAATTSTGARYAARSTGQPSAHAVVATSTATTTAAAEIRSVRTTPGYACRVDAAGNYDSGDDYVVEYTRYRFSFNAQDFEERVTAAAVKLGLVGGNELDDDETADLVELVECDGSGAALAARPLSHSPVGRALPRRRRIACLLAEALVFRGAWLDHRVKQGKLEVGFDEESRRVRLPRPTGRPRLARASADAELARAAVPAVIRVPRWYAVAGPAYLAALLAVDTQVGLNWQYVLGAVTWLVLLAALRPLPALARAQAFGVVVFATVGEVAGSLIWGVYHYRLHNLPLFIPPAHGIVYLSGLALAGLVRERVVVAVAAVGAMVGGSRADGAAAPRRRRRVRRAVALRLPLALARRVRCTRACSSSLPRSSCTARRSASGAGLTTCPGSAFLTEIRRAASRAATSGST